MRRVKRNRKIKHLSVLSIAMGLSWSLFFDNGPSKAIASPTPHLIATASPSAETYRIQGLAYRQQGRFDEAIAALKIATDLDPTNVSGQVLLGWTQTLPPKRLMRLRR